MSPYRRISSVFNQKLGQKLGQRLGHMPQLRWSSLRIRIIAWSFIPTVIILMAVALVTLYAYQQVTEDLVIGRNRELTRLAAGQLTVELEGHADLLTAVTHSADMSSDDFDVRRRALAEARNRLVVFDAGVVMLDGSGRLVAAEPARPEQMGQEWSDRAYFRQMIRSPGPVFSNIEADGPNRAEVIVVAVPIFGPQGDFQGTLAGMFHLGTNSVSAFYGGITKLRMAESGSPYIVDAYGRVIYHVDFDHVGSSLYLQPVVQLVLEKQVGDLRTTGLNGKDSVASYAPVPGTPWGLVIEEDWHSLISSSQGYNDFLLILLALGVIVPAVVVTFAVSRITGPIQEMIHAAREVAGGNFGRKVIVQSGDELEELAKQFNMMSLELQESYTSLEQRVADRTKELATLNAVAAVASGSLDLKEILYGALDKVLEATGMDVGTAYVGSKDDQSLDLVARRGMSEVLPPAMLCGPVQGSVSEAMVAVQQPIVRLVGDYPTGEIKDFLEEQGLQLVVGVPLLAKGRVVGVVIVCSRRVRTLTDDEVSLLAAVGQQIGVAVENARLYEEAEETAAVAERTRLARDLHDAVSQTLFSASLIAEVLPRLWERHPDEARRRLEELRQLTRGALAEMRTLLLELRPAALMDAALGDLLRQLTEAITGRARIPVTLTVEGECLMQPDVKVAFYRIAQEALNNVAKHAGARQGAVTLHCAHGAITLQISDDGRGFEQSLVTSDHLGLGIMRERAEAIGAELRVESQVGRGTKIEVIWRDLKGRESV